MRKKGEGGVRSRCSLHAARCFHARLRCSGSGQDIVVALFYSIFSSYFFFVFVLHLCQRSRRAPAWTRIGNNLLCLTAGMYVCMCVTARPHAHVWHGECIILTFAWRVSWPRCLFRPFGISPTPFFAISFRAEHLNSLAVPIMKSFVSACTTWRQARHTL